MINKELLLSLDDVTLEPLFSTIKSRKDVDITNLLGNHKIIPIISSNMDTVTDAKLAIAMHRAGAIGALHRFCTIEQNVSMYQDTIRNGATSIGSFGIGKAELERAEALYNAGCNILILDVAHGAAMHVVEQYNAIRDIVKDNALIVVGNFATGQTIKTFNHHSRIKLEMVKINVGSGCFAAGTRILMADGSYKSIENINVNDWVINKDGKSVKVIGVKFSGYKNVLKYKTNTFYKHTYATPDHQHWVGDHSTTKAFGKRDRAKFLDQPTRFGDSKYCWKRLDALQKATMLLPKNIQFSIPETFEINMSDFYNSRRTMQGYTELSELVLKPSYELGYLIGTFLGDGHANIRKSKRFDGRQNTTGALAWHFYKHEVEIATKVQNFLKVVFNANSVIKENARKNVLNVFCRNNYLSRFFLQFYKDGEKHLAHSFICQNKEYLNGLYSGLMDSDGHYGADNREAFTNISPDLMESYMLIHYLTKGYYPSMTNRKPTVGTLVNCDIRNVRHSYIARGLKSPEHYMTKDYFIVPFQEPQTTELIVDTYDIEVDCNTHSFIANNVIVHNSRCSTRVVTGCGFPSISSLLSCRQAGVPMIQDGGIRNSGDIAKSLAAGAQFVMCGNLFAGCSESPGRLIYNDKGVLCKEYRGSASAESYKVQGKESEHRAPEGVSAVVPYTGTVQDTINMLGGGLRSAFSYVDARTVAQFQENAKLHVVSTNSALESNPRL